MKKVKLFVVKHRVNTKDPKVISDYCKTNGKVIEFVDELPLNMALYEITYENDEPISIR